MIPTHISIEGLYWAHDCNTSRYSLMNNIPDSTDLPLRFNPKILYGLCRAVQDTTSIKKKIGGKQRESDGSYDCNRPTYCVNSRQSVHPTKNNIAKDSRVCGPVMFRCAVRDETHKYSRNLLKRMQEVVFLRLGTQHVIQIQRLLTLKPSAVVGIHREGWWGMWLAMNYSGPSANVRECSTPIKGPAIDVISMMQLVKILEPVVEIRMSPLRFGNHIHRLMCVLIYERFVRGHPIGSQCIQDV
jgi:hypothetical protein